MIKIKMSMSPVLQCSAAKLGDLQWLRDMHDDKFEGEGVGEGICWGNSFGYVSRAVLPLQL